MSSWIRSARLDPLRRILARLVPQCSLRVLLEDPFPVAELEPVSRLVHQYALLGGVTRVLGREEEPRTVLAFAPVIRIVRRWTMTGVAHGVGERRARMRLVQTRTASGAVPARLSVVMRAVSAGGTLAALGVTAARTPANHSPTWTASAAVRAVAVVPDVRPALARLESRAERTRQMVSTRGTHKFRGMGRRPASDPRELRVRIPAAKLRN